MSKVVPKNNELREKSKKDLLKMLKEWKKYLAELSIRHSLRELKETHLIKSVKKTLARINFYVNN